MASERSVSEVFQDIVRNVQEIVRAEIRLAKVEIRSDLKKAVSSIVWIAAGGAAAMGAGAFFLWTAVYALATRMSMWAATLTVALIMSGVAAVLMVVGIRMLTRLQPLPERTVESVKENLEWMKQPVK